MLSNFLNLPGVTILSKAEQKKVSGGQMCKFNVGEGWTRALISFSEGSDGSAEANAMCVEMIANLPDVSSCRYDCSYDGYGQ